MSSFVGNSTSIAVHENGDPNMIKLIVTMTIRSSKFDSCIFFSFQYVYEKGVSKPIFKTYRTVPQPPLDVTLTDFSDIELTSFSSPITAHWASPEKDSELDGYQVIWPGQNLTQFIGKINKFKIVNGANFSEGKHSKK